MSCSSRAGQGRRHLANVLAGSASPPYNERLMKFGLTKMGQTFLGWLPAIILAIPSIWLLASVPPLWRDIDGYNQVTLPPGAMTILQFSPLYSFGARLPLYAGCALDSFFAHHELPGWGFFAHPILTDCGVFLLVALQHLLLLRAQTFLLRTVSTTFLVQIFLSALLAFNSSFYTFAHSVGTEAAALSASIWFVGCTVRIFSSRVDRRSDWIWFGVSLTICILLRHINAVLAALLPLAYFLSGGAETVRALFRRGAARFPRRLVRRELSRGCLSVIVALLCLAVASRTVRFISRSAGIHYRSTVGLTFVWRLDFLARMDPDQRTAFLTRLAGRTGDPMLKRMLLEMPSAISESGQWDPPACIQNLLEIMEDSGIRENTGYRLDLVRNNLAKIFLLSFERPYLSVVWNDFLATGRIALLELAISPFSTTQYCFLRLNEMPQVIGLTTFKGDTARPLLAAEKQKNYYRWMGFSFCQALTGWVLLALLCCIFLRGLPRRIIGLTTALVCVGLTVLFLTCLLSELLPRYLLPSWVLLLAAALLSAVHFADSLVKRRAAGRA